MTIHAAKGLEFHTVFILDANEGKIPYKKPEQMHRRKKKEGFLCGHDPGKRKTDSLLCENKKRKRDSSFPLCR